jgi:hypothetical protein
MYLTYLNDSCQDIYMRKLLLAVFLLISTLVFGKVIDQTEYWNKEIGSIQWNIQQLDKDYNIAIQATETELTITVTKGDYYFTKYDNISIAAIVYRYLNFYSPKADRYLSIKEIIIESYPYTRTILISDLKKEIILSKKVFKVGDFIDASKVQNELQLQSQAKK